ncbi:hypothetical protein [Desulforamulus putei]|uniref:Uncharacterized protein n=1 Tax=Desulforamulus putei DSM 12395 TaxID=1121429 RepID=A0A1M4SNZ0_9FIRM|nr:hypothetical protein [Desulforamulus putei]SHE33882.1 hypothetical protein SAMN02745133_00186 [Desulforamulus putei DSM 12395]
MGTQQLVNGQMIISSIAKYSITNESSFHLPKFEPCVDAYDQLIFMITKEYPELKPSFDLYGQLISIS